MFKCLSGCCLSNMNQIFHQPRRHQRRRLGIGRMRGRNILARLFVLRVMKSKFDAFKNHMVYMNLKNLNVKKMPYSTKGFSMQMSTQK